MEEEWAAAMEEEEWAAAMEATTMEMRRRYALAWASPAWHAQKAALCRDISCTALSAQAQAHLAFRHPHKHAETVLCMLYSPLLFPAWPSQQLGPSSRRWQLPGRGLHAGPAACRLTTTTAVVAVEDTGAMGRMARAVRSVATMAWEAAMTTLALAPTTVVAVAATGERHPAS